MIAIKTINMKKLYILFILVAFKGFSQNETFYKSVPGFTNVKYYNQVNTTPYIFKNDMLLNENVYPNWYKGLMFHKSPGIFSSVDELYSYLGDDPRFTQNPVRQSTYDHKTDPAHQAQYFDLGKKSLNKSKLYLDDLEFLDAVNGNSTQLYKRYSIIHREIYLRIDNDDFLVLTYSSMTPEFTPTEVEIQKVTNYINGETAFRSEIENSRCLVFAILHKENGKWKSLGDDKRALQFIADKNLNPILTELLKYSSDSATVVSSINNSGNRVYVEQ